MSLPQAIRQVGSLGLYAGFSGALFVGWKLWRKALVKSARSLVSRTKSGSRGFLVGYQAMLFCAIVAGLMAMVAFRPPATHYVYKNLRVRRLVGKNSLDLISTETGPFTAEFCPTPPLQQYEPKAGYVLCRLAYVDRGCMDISSRLDGFIWVKDKSGVTTTLSETDTFQPWPNCVKDEVKPSA
jgi:hypothetical protein